MIFVVTKRCHCHLVSTVEAEDMKDARRKLKEKPISDFDVKQVRIHDIRIFKYKPNNIFTAATIKEKIIQGLTEVQK